MTDEQKVNGAFIEDVLIKHMTEAAIYNAGYEYLYEWLFVYAKIIRDSHISPAKAQPILHAFMRLACVAGTPTLMGRHGHVLDATVDKLKLLAFQATKIDQR